MFSPTFDDQVAVADSENSFGFHCLTISLEEIVCGKTLFRGFIHLFIYLFFDRETKISL